MKVHRKRDDSLGTGEDILLTKGCCFEMNIDIYRVHWMMLRPKPGSLNRVSLLFQRQTEHEGVRP